MSHIISDYFARWESAILTFVIVSLKNEEDMFKSAQKRFRDVNVEILK